MKRELNKYLKELTKKELEAEIKKLYTKFKAVKNFYDMELSQDTAVILEQFKQRIQKEYLPIRGFGRASNRESKKVITEFKKICVFKEDLIDLILFRVKIMLDYTFTYGDIDEPFYSSMESSFGDACKLIKTEKLEQKYDGELRDLIEQASQLGWGVYDGLTYFYREFIGDFTE